MIIIGLKDNFFDMLASFKEKQGVLYGFEDWNMSLVHIWTHVDQLHDSATLMWSD